MHIERKNVMGFPVLLAILLVAFFLPPAGFGQSSIGNVPETSPLTFSSAEKIKALYYLNGELFVVSADDSGRAVYAMKGDNLVRLDKVEIEMAPVGSSGQAASARVTKLDSDGNFGIIRGIKYPVSSFILPIKGSETFGVSSFYSAEGIYVGAPNAQSRSGSVFFVSPTGETHQLGKSVGRRSGLGASLYVYMGTVFSGVVNGHELYAYDEVSKSWRAVLSEKDLESGKMVGVGHSIFVAKRPEHSYRDDIFGLAKALFSPTRRASVSVYGLDGNKKTEVKHKNFGLVINKMLSVPNKDQIVLCSDGRVFLINSEYEVITLYDERPDICERPFAVSERAIYWFDPLASSEHPIKSISLSKD